MHSCLFARRNDGLDKIACLDTVYIFGLLCSSTRKSIAIHPAHLSLPMSVCCDEQRANAFDMKVLRRTFAHTRCIYPVLFRQSSRGSVELGESTTPTFHRHAQRLEPLKECPSGCIDRRCIFERRLGLCQDP